MARNKSARLQAKQNKSENRISDDQLALLNLLDASNIQKEELESIIKARAEGLVADIDFFKRQQEEQWLNNEFPGWKAEKQSDFEKNLLSDNDALVSANKTLREEIEQKQSEKDFINTEIVKLNKEKVEAVKAKEQVIQDTEKYKVELRQKVQKELKAQEDELGKREKDVQGAEEALNNEKTRFEEVKKRTEEDFALKREEIARDRSVVDSDRALLDKMRALYADCSSSKFQYLQAELKQTSSLLESKAEELGRVTRERDSLKLEKLMREGLSEEELRSENTLLKEKVENFENKFGSYTDARLREMENAYNTQSEKNEQIEQLHSQLLTAKNELARIQNNQLTTEQELAQLDLVRTLNKALRRELDNTRRMIEGSSGDICVSLTDIDNEVANKFGVHNSELEIIKGRSLQSNRSLSDIIDHVNEYAASRPRPLYYSKSNLRAFLAGLSVSRLSILQGMSGTGKTSLPRVFVEALSGLISVVPVESSWRDRNELLGYYNDFSKRFSAKEFTCSLYRAGLKPYSDIPYFIVLDEMNLSRVEYYFADFLSVLEAAPEDWQISLVDIDMRQLPTEINDRMKAALAEDARKQNEEITSVVKKYLDSLNNKGKTNVSSSSDLSLSVGEKSKLVAYLASREEEWKKEGKFESVLQGPSNLIDGKKIIVPRNVWFIGTANRDESTFEITDKVYDRAQVLNFNERAVKQFASHNPEPIKITVQYLEKLFEKARRDYPFKVEEDPVLREVERELNKHGVAYGNRIADQIERFVPVYVAAGANSNVSRDALRLEAIDYQITNKVLRKLDVNELSKDSINSLSNLLDQCKLDMALTYILNQIDK